MSSLRLDLGWHHVTCVGAVCQGEDEAMFVEYRKQLKMLLDRLAQVSPELLLEAVRRFFASAMLYVRSAPWLALAGGVEQEFILICVRFTCCCSCFGAAFRNWQAAPFMEVEVAIRLLYMLGEALPASHGAHFSGDSTKTSVLQDMMRTVRHTVP